MAGQVEREWNSFVIAGGAGKGTYGSCRGWEAALVVPRQLIIMEQGSGEIELQERILIPDEY